ncbi:recombination-associated protein RdgC [Laribacter hongkongensis]|uniref:recombination-associated protein RdgC n=1 Tax=Laribacter hongkongensis TaxID=168471 RepID=UPI001EFE8ABA|nr:recombination-associated protein RdgC [Laribacter hongkongensis]MCG9078972.1 recombination-associated protein RdgC [Laribacter hongkongensis]
MWFRKLALFRLPAEQGMDFDALEQGMARHVFAPPTSLEWNSKGFVAPASHAPDRLVHPLLQNAALVTLKREEKVLPASAIREALAARIADIEKREARPVGRKEKRELKEQITDELLPRAITRVSAVRALIDVHTNWIMIDATGLRAEDTLSALREAMPPLPARLPHTRQSPGSVMTGWLANGEAPGAFGLDSDAVMKSPGNDAATVRVSRQDLTTSEVRQHIDTGKVVVELGLIWRERIRFVLTDKLELKRLQFLDVLQEQASQAGDDAPALFDATAVLMLGELRELGADLIDAMGGYMPCNTNEKDDKGCK